MAQLVEQLIRNQQVAGSSPATSLEPVVFFMQKANTATGIQNEKKRRG